MGTETFKIQFEVNAAGSETQEAAFTTVFQFNDPTADNFHSAGAAIRVPFFYDFRGGVLEYGPTGDRVSEEQLLDPSYYSLFIARDQDSFFDNDESAAKVDGTLYFDSGLWTEIKAGLRVSERSINRSRLSQVSQNFRGSPVQISRTTSPPLPATFCIPRKRIVFGQFPDR